MPRTRTEALECRHCGCRMSTVTHTRVHEVSMKGRKRVIIRRRRVCRHCSIPYTTIECYEDDDQPMFPEPFPPPHSFPYFHHYSEELAAVSPPEKKGGPLR